MIDWRAHVREHLPPLAVAPERELEIIEELALQFEAAYDSAISAAAVPADAHERALAEVPDWSGLATTLSRIERPTTLQRSAAASDSGGFMHGFTRDVMRALATLIRAPGFTAVSVLTLAIGLGVGLTAFVLVNGVLLAPLPYADPDRLVLVHATVPPEGRDTQQHAYPDIADLAQSGAFSSLAAIVGYSGTTTIADPPMRLLGLSLTPNAFDVFGVTPALGRLFSKHDGERGASPVAVMAHGLWTRLGSPPDVIGKTMVLDEVPRTIVGVAPARFRFDIFPAAADVFLPITDDFGPILQLRAVRAFRVVGRLAPGVTTEGADAAVETVSSRLAQAYPATNRGRQFSVRPLRDDIVSGARGPLMLVATLVAVVVLIVAVNLSGFWLSRAVKRAREMSIRVALGASHGRLMRESFAEALLLALAASGVGYGLARVLLSALRTAPGLTLPRLAEIEVSNSAAFALVAVAILVAATLSLLAHVSPRRLQSLTTLRTGHETSDRRTGFIRGALVAGQTSLAFVLVASAILLAASLTRALQMPVGFDRADVVTMRLMVPPTRYENRAATVAFYSQVLDSLRGHGEIKHAGVVSALPLDGGAGSSLTIAGHEEVPEAMRPSIRWYWASDGYFGALGIPVLQGRDFTAADLTRTSHVTIVNDSLARLYFPGENPIGKRVYFGPVPTGGVNDWHEIVGVVGDIHNRTIEEGALPAAFDLFGQHWGRDVALAVRSDAGVAPVTSVVRRVIAERDPRLALFSVRTTSDLIANAVSTRRLMLWLVAGFAVIGSLVAILGLYGTVSYIVSGRTREMGVRIALGATSRDIHRLVLGYGLRFAGIGIAVGITGAIAIRGVLQNQLFGVQAINGLIFAVAASVLVAASLLACVEPARRAVGIDAVRSLKTD